VQRVSFWANEIETSCDPLTKASPFVSVVHLELVGSLKRTGLVMFSQLANFHAITFGKLSVEQFVQNLKLDLS